LSKICKPDETSYLDKICTTFAKENNKEAIELHISKLDKLQASIYRYQDEILLLLGVGDAHQNVNKVAQTIRNVLGHLEDILCAALIGADEVKKMWEAGKFAYQENNSV